MGFSRAVAEPRPSNDVLTARMAGIGMNFAATPERDADIEGTLVQASSLGMDDADLRVLSVLTTWLGVHHAHVNADRLIRVVAEHESPRVHAYWAAIASWLAKDRRFARLSASEGAAVDLLPVGTDFQLKRKGEDERFVLQRSPETTHLCSVEPDQARNAIATAESANKIHGHRSLSLRARGS